MCCWLLLLVATAVTCRGEELGCAQRPPSDVYQCAVDSQEPIYPCLESGSALIGQGKRCTPIAGMALTIVCIGDPSLVLYSKNVSFSNNEVTYERVTPSHAGVYECRYEVANNNQTQVIESSRTVEVIVPGKHLKLRVCYN